MHLDELIEVVDGVSNINSKELINSIKTDSRKINKNDIFIALTGDKYDGHNYVLEAIENGAMACIISQDLNIVKCIRVKDTYKSLFDISKYIRSKYNIPLIAITGSNGKTTTKDLIAFILESKYNVLRNEGSKNNLIGVSDTIFNLNANYDIAVLEFGSNHMGEIEYLSKMCNPTISIITNIGSSHLEFFKKRKNIFKEKLSIVNGMSKKNLIVNGDDKYLKKINAYKCGLNENNDLIAYNIYCNVNSISFNIFLDKEYKIVFNNPGIHFIPDILLSIKVCIDYGIDIKTIIKYIKNFKLTDKRMNFIKLNSNIIINDCYNASYESIVAGINYLQSINEQKIIILADILELGKYSKKVHKKVNKKLKSINNKIVFTIGNYTKYISGIHFDNLEDFINYLENYNIKNSYIYIKGSRRMGLDKVVEFFKEKKSII